MRKIKQFAIISSAIFMLFVLAACNQSTSGKGEATPEEVMEDAVQKLSEVTSMESKVTTDMEIMFIYDGQTSTTNTKTIMNLAAIQEPIKLKGDSTTMTYSSEKGDGAEGDTQKVDMYVLQEDNTRLTLYYNDGTGWNSETINTNDFSHFNTISNMRIYLDNVSEDTLQEAGEDIINEKKVVKYTGVIEGDAMEAVLQSSGMLAGLELSEALKDTDLNAIFNELEDVPISVWISEEGYPVRYDLDMKDLMSRLFEMMADQDRERFGDIEITCPKMQLVMDCFNFNTVEDFEVPAEATQ